MSATRASARLEGFFAACRDGDPRESSRRDRTLARYRTRPALPLWFLSLTNEGLVRYGMKRSFSDGRSDVLPATDDFLVPLALIPLPTCSL